MNDNRPQMSIAEFIDTATTIYEPNRIPVILWGTTGVGKTDVMITLATLTDRILRVFYPAGMEPPDLSGLPMQSLKNAELIEFKKSEQIHFEPGKKYLIFWDELNRATIDMQQAVLGLYNKRPYFGVHDISHADLWVVTAMNDMTLQDGVMVNDVDDALRTRAAQVVLRPTTQEVGDYLATKYPNNFIANFLRSQYISGVVERDFGDVYRTSQFIMPTPRNFEMAAKIVQGKTVQQIEQSFKALHSILGIAAVSAIAKYIKSIEQIDPQILFNDGDSTKRVLDEYLRKPITQETTAVLLEAFSNALAMSVEHQDEKNGDPELKALLRNLMYIEKRPDGSAGYKDVIAAFFNTVRTSGMRHLVRVLANKEFMTFFREFHHNAGRAQAKK
jgi:hypothetical protein